MKKQVAYYKGNNNWSKDRYKYMSELNIESGIKEFGASSKGNRYYHLVEADKLNSYNLLGEQQILDAVNDRFKQKAGDKKRVLTNTVASQPCCFNLFAPLSFNENKELTNSLFSNLLGKIVNVTSIDIEFTPTSEESIGDQSKFGGTDADLGVFYDYDTNKKGVILVEFKYIENKFSICSSYRTKNGGVSKGKAKKNIRPACNSHDFFEKNINSVNDKTNPDCGYVRYENWELTKSSSVFNFKKIKKSGSCPFRFSFNQLWRNLLLAEKVAKVRNLNEFHFWVLNPRQNEKLWNNHNENIFSDFSNILNEEKKHLFRKLDIENDFVNFLENNNKNEWNKNWLKKFRTKYLTTKYIYEDK